MRFMVIEHFPPGAALEIYRTLAEGGRALPEGLTYVESWVEAGFNRCFQVMETDDPALFHAWALQWQGHGVRLEITPVLTSAETQALIAPLLSAP